MIEFNENDFNLPEIKKDSKLSNIVTKYEYEIYGLLQEDNPPILLEVPPQLTNEFDSKTLINFFNKNLEEIVAELKAA